MEIKQKQSMEINQNKIHEIFIKGLPILKEKQHRNKNTVISKL